MGIKKTIERYKQEVCELGNDEYEVLSDEYFGNKTPLKMLHKKCGFEYMVKPNVFLTGSRCPFCAGKVRKDTNYFKNEMKNIVGNEYSAISEYKNTYTKMKFRHNICGNEFDMTPHNFLAGQRCPQCQHRSYTKTTDEFKQEVYNLVGDEYDVIGEYINRRTKITMKHRLCNHDYQVRPGEFVQGSRCPYCYGNMKKTQQQFVDEVFDKKGDEYSVLGKYINFTTKVDVRHNKCGYVWGASPANILYSNSGCPKCKESRGEKSIRHCLDSLKIDYELQKKYDDLFGVGNRKLSYDFYLPNQNILIEYQGHMHDRPVSFYGGDEGFKIQKEHDIRKKEYAQNNNIELLEIWYWDYENIECILKSRLLKQSA